MRLHLAHLPPGPVAATLDSSHLEACLRLDRLALGGFWSSGQWRAELGEPGRLAIGLAEAGELVAIACGWLVVDELHVTLVAVDPARRRQGLGRRVLSGLITAAQGRGARRATLEVAAGNAAARALYTAVGFHLAGRRRGYYRNGDDALIEWMEIRPRRGCG
jgi:ribosomal-protein-alanine N-acetyltransferase